MPKDVDALAVWDAKARTLIDRIDAALAAEGGPAAKADTVPLDALVHRVIARTPPPAGEIVPIPATNSTKPTKPTNMGPQPDRIDQWDAYVCRFDSDGAAEPGRAAP